MAFDQNLGTWDIDKVTDMDNMFLYVCLSPANYDGILNGWAAQVSREPNVTFHGGYSYHTSAGTASRAALVGTGWTITDGGLNTDVSLSSAPGTDLQTVCLNAPIVSITYNFPGTTPAVFTGLPAGVTGSVNDGVATISGTPTVAGIYNYSVDGCGALTGSIRVVGDVSWAGGGSYTWTINDATGTAGGNPGWNVQEACTLDITATSGSPFTIYITSQTLANAPGAAANFNNLNTYTWILARGTSAITGFDAGKFTLNTDSFVNDMGDGTFTIEQSGNDLNLKFTAGWPTAVEVSWVRAYSENRRVFVEWKTAWELGSVGFDVERLSNGEWVRVNPHLIPALNSPMGGQYRVEDPGAPVRPGILYRLIEFEESGAIQRYGPFEVTHYPLASQLRIDRTADGWKLVFAGESSVEYSIEATGDLEREPWGEVGRVRADEGGRLTWDIQPARDGLGMRFYRAVRP